MAHMKTHMTLSMEAELVTSVRELAAQVGAPHSVLISLFITEGLRKHTVMALKTWAEARRVADLAHRHPVMGSSHLTAAERRMLARVPPSDWAAFDRPNGHWWRALLSLQAAGLVEARDFGAVVKDANGRPLKSYWRRKSQP